MFLSFPIGGGACRNVLMAAMEFRVQREFAHGHCRQRGAQVEATEVF